MSADTRSVEASVYTANHVLEFLDDRLDWLDREMKNGGDLNHLGIRYRECRYIAECIRDTKTRLEAIRG